MRRDFRVARACATEAIRDFRLHEYAPFGWILAVQLLFLLVVQFLDTIWGMATAGSLIRMVLGDNSLHYPGLYLRLPSVAQRLEAFLYTVPGAVLVPLCLIRIQAPMNPELATKAVLGPRLKQAFLPTLIASVVNSLLLELWQMLLKAGPVTIMRVLIPGFAGQAVLWFVAIVVAFGVSALFIYIPIVSVLSDYTTLKDRLVQGFREGVALFRQTIFIIFFFSWPALIFLFMTQMRTGFILDRMRPEIVAILLAVYAILISVATYLIYAAAARLHWAGSKEEEEEATS